MRRAAVQRLSEQRVTQEEVLSFQEKLLEQHVAKHMVHAMDFTKAADCAVPLSLLSKFMLSPEARLAEGFAAEFLEVRVSETHSIQAYR